MITTKDKLKIQLLKHNEHERLSRHADVEIAYSAEKDTTANLQKQLLRLTEENAELRHDIKKYEKIFSDKADTIG